MKLCKLLLTVVVVALALGALVASASARNLSSSSLTWRSAFTTIGFLGSGGTRTSCAVTLEASLHARTFTKVSATLIGYVNAASVSGCTATVLTATLPWHVRFGDFSGMLPAITSFRTNIIGFALQTAESFMPCLITSTAEEPFVQTYNRNTATGELTSTQLGGMIRTRNCLEATMRFTASSNSITVGGAATRISVRLI